MKESYAPDPFMHWNIFCGLKFAYNFVNFCKYYKLNALLPYFKWVDGKMSDFDFYQFLVPHFCLSTNYNAIAVLFLFINHKCTIQYYHAIERTNVQIYTFHERILMSSFLLRSRNSLNGFGKWHYCIFIIWRIEIF